MTHLSAEIPLYFQLKNKMLEIKRRGLPLINLHSGQTDLVEPEHLRIAAALEGAFGRRGYGPTLGNTELRQAFVGALFERHGYIYKDIGENPSRDHIAELSRKYGKNAVITNGGKGALHHAISCILKKAIANDQNQNEVVLFAPAYDTYYEEIRAAGGKVVLVEEPSEENLQIAVGVNTALIIINTPQNPSGKVWSAEELGSVGNSVRIQRAQGRRVYVISDACYEHLVDPGLYPEGIPIFARVNKDLADLSVFVTALSKYVDPRHRLGLMLVPAALRESIENQIICEHSNVASVSQAVGLAFYTGNAILEMDGYTREFPICKNPQDFLKDSAQIFAKRRDLLRQQLVSCGLESYPAQSTFYSYFDCSSWLGKTRPDGRRLRSSVDVADYLLDTVYVATLPGVIFYDLRPSEEYVSEGQRTARGSSSLKDLGIKGESQLRIALTQDRRSLENACARISIAYQLLSLGGETSAVSDAKIDELNNLFAEYQSADSDSEDSENIASQLGQILSQARASFTTH